MGTPRPSKSNTDPALSGDETGIYFLLFEITLLSVIHSTYVCVRVSEVLLTKFPVSQFLLAQLFLECREVSLCAGCLETSLSASSARASVFFHVRACSRLLISGASRTLATIVKVPLCLCMTHWQIFLRQVEQNNATIIMLLSSFPLLNRSISFSTLTFLQSQSKVPDAHMHTSKQTCRSVIYFVD